MTVLFNKVPQATIDTPAVVNVKKRRKYEHDRVENLLQEKMGH